MAKAKFTIVLIKPSHYDDDGYVIQWRRSTIPSNSLASVYGLLRESADERVLGPDVEIEFEIYDECNTIVDIPAISRRILAHRGFVALVGVQSNQFPARPRHWPPVPGEGRDRRCRRVPRLGLHRHAAGIAAGPQTGAGVGHDPVRGRGRRPTCGVPEGHRLGEAEACLQLSRQHAGYGRCGDSGSAARGRDPGRRTLYEL